MNAQLTITSCTVRAERLSDKKTLLLSMEILGHNTGKYAIHNMNLVTSITGARETVERHINIARRISPGENFHYTWNTDLSTDAPEDAALLAAPKLQCLVRPHTMTLSSGEMLYIRPKPTPVTEAVTP